jgi:hypothetical protein
MPLPAFGLVVIVVLLWLRARKRAAMAQVVHLPTPPSPPLAVSYRRIAASKRHRAALSTLPSERAAHTRAAEKYEVAAEKYEVLVRAATQPRTPPPVAVQNTYPWDTFIGICLVIIVVIVVRTIAGR